jgi:hypothetical protein
MTQSTTAVYRDGQLVLETPVDWPDGQKVFVTAVSSPETNLYDVRPEEAGWSDDPGEIQARIERLRSIEPWEMTPEEEKGWLEFREQVKQYTLDAIRKEMGLQR